MPLRTDLNRPKRRVLVHGLVYFGRVFADLMDGSGWSFHYFADSGIHNLACMARELNACDLVYQIGGRVTRGKFLQVAHFLEKPKIVMHWVGSDTLDEQKEVAQGCADPWVLQRLYHWAESKWMVQEVKSLGISCDLVPLPSAFVPDQPTALPEKFRVLVYVPTVKRADLYGLDRVLEVARKLPDISFDLVGLLDGPIPNPPSNLTTFGRIPNLQQFYQRCSVVWRPVRHDGLSWMVLESLGHGRHVLWSYPFPGCVQVSSAADACEYISRLYSLHQQGRLRINEDGARFIADEGYLPQFLRGAIHSRLEQILQS
jgi:hypothetical protein